MPIEQVMIRTADGDCSTYVLSPGGDAKSPAVIFYADAGGMRPAMLKMAEHLSDAGYVVLLPDPFYRFGPYEPLVPVEVFKGDVAAILGPLMATTGNDKAAEDAAAFLAYLDTREDIAGDKIGAVGFCMGGGMAISAAARYPDRFAAVASFHGGNLATDAPTSPHLRVSELAATLYIGVADQDEHYPTAMAARFEDALTKAGVSYRAELYPGARHGWMVPDFPVYDADAAHRGWKAMLVLFDKALCE